MDTLFVYVYVSDEMGFEELKLMRRLSHVPVAFSEFSRVLRG
jgi:hypothetical protein